MKYVNWNASLQQAIESFVNPAEHPGATALYFSAHNVFNAFLDDPERYGFQEADKKLSGGGIWNDHLHPTSAVHNIIAKELADFLKRVPVASK
jgi:phospholipase/lecithinase/hemolysin